MIYTLPGEVGHLIFDFLDADELIRCKIVCKNWKTLIDKYDRFKEIILRDNGESSNSWFFTFKSIDPKYIVHCKKPNLFNYKTFSQHFVNLKKFKSNLRLDFDLEQLNAMTKLEHIELDNDLNLNRKMTLLYLSNLEIFKINKLSGKLQIDSIRLRVLCVHDMTNIEIHNPDTVNHIYLNTSYNTNFSKFSHLESLSIRNIIKLDKKIMFKLPAKIKSLHFYNPYHTNDMRRLFNDISNMLVHEMILADELKVKIYFQGKILFKSIQNDFIIQSFSFNTGVPLKIDGDNPFRAYHFLLNDELDIFYTNFELLEPNLYWHDAIEYDFLVNLFQPIIPSKFYKKFINIHSLTINGQVNDENSLLVFLSNCGSLSKLKLHGPSLNPNFYNQLPNFCNLLQEFVLYEQNICLNFNFIFKFKQLKTLIINQKLEYFFIRLMFDKLGFIEDIRFRANVRTCIRKYERFCNLLYGGEEYGNLEYSELFNLLKNHII